MNKLLLLVVACVLSISTIGATATVSATQIGHSPFYYFDVMNNGKAVGYVVVNAADPKTPTYTLVANGLTPNTNYTFGYTASGDVHTLGSAYTTVAGALVTSGPFPAADVKDLQTAQFWVTVAAAGAGGSSYPQIFGFSLYTKGAFAAAIRVIIAPTMVSRGINLLVQAGYGNTKAPRALIPFCLACPTTRW